MTKTVYKICSKAAWRAAVEAGSYTGSPVDAADGYIHLSSVAQVAETAARHFARQTDMVLVAVDADRLGDDLRWEKSRSGALFPHLYAPLRTNLVRWTYPLPLGPDGNHEFPEGILP